MLKNMRNAHRMGGKWMRSGQGLMKSLKAATNGKVLKKSYNSHLLKEYMEPSR